MVRSGKVRRAKLYYLRDRTGKSARIAEKIRKKIGIEIETKIQEVTDQNVMPSTETPKEETKPAEAPKEEAKPVEAPKEEAKPVEAPKKEEKSSEAKDNKTEVSSEKKK